MKRKRTSSYDNRPFKKPATLVRQNATLHNQVVREMHRIQDLKYTDTYTANGVTTSGLIIPLLGNLIRGTAGFNNFLGNTITPKGLTINYNWNTQQEFNNVRIFVFQWRDASTPVPSGVLQNISALQGVVSPVLVTNRTICRSLANRVDYIAPTAADGGVGISVAIVGYGGTCGTIYVPAKKMLNPRFASVTNVCQDNNLYILAITDDAVPVNPQLSLYSRLSFYDS